jgi:hypothetical protein
MACTFCMFLHGSGFKRSTVQTARPFYAAKCLKGCCPGHSADSSSRSVWPKCTPHALLLVGQVGSTSHGFSPRRRSAWVHRTGPSLVLVVRRGPFGGHLLCTTYTRNMVLNMYSNQGGEGRCSMHISFSILKCSYTLSMHVRC